MSGVKTSGHIVAMCKCPNELMEKYRIEQSDKKKERNNKSCLNSTNTTGFYLIRQAKHL